MNYPSNNTNEYYSSLFQHFEQILQRWEKEIPNLVINTSVLSIVRSYQPHNLIDLECWAFLCALLDFQIKVRDWFIPMMSGLMRYLSEHNLSYIDLIENPLQAETILKSFRWQNKQIGFSHRLVSVADILEINHMLKKIINQYDSLGTYIHGIYNTAVNSQVEVPLAGVLEHFTSELQQYVSPEFKSKGILPDFRKKSAMKRLLLYLRWMVRPYPDLYKWTFISLSDLLAPIDLGIIRVFQRTFGITIKKTPTWTDVLNLSNILRQINPADPIKYDFILSRPVLAGYCQKNLPASRCYMCPLCEICQQKNPFPEFILSEPLSSNVESEIFQKFLQQHGDSFDQVKTEIQLGSKRADALLHIKKDGWLIAEVERELNYASMGQALSYKRLFLDLYKEKADPVIICREINADLKRACDIDVGIKIFQV